MSTKPTTHRAHVSWDAGEAKPDLRAHTVEVARQTIAGSCSAALGGDPSKADPEELFVASLSACHMLWFLDFARRERIRVVSYRDEAEGTMDGERFTRVVLRPAAQFHGDPPVELIDELHSRAHRACFIANSVSCSVDVAWRLVDVEAV